MTLKEFVAKYVYGSPVEVCDEDGVVIIRNYDGNSPADIGDASVLGVSPVFRLKKRCMFAQAVLVVTIKYGLVKERTREKIDFFKDNKDGNAYAYNSFKGHSDTEEESCPQ